MEKSTSINRRSLLTAVPVFGTAMAANSQASETKPEGDKNGGNVIRVGCLNVGIYSHLSYNWASLINPAANSDEIPLTGMRITHCWDIDHGHSKGFAERHGCQAVKNFDDMLGKVDGIISGGYYNHPWNHILHEPYLEAGLPNLINRPFSNSLDRARKMIELARKNKATILVPSAFEHTNEIVGAKEWATGKHIVCYSASNGADDYPTHGIHGVYLMFRAIVESGNPVVSVSYRANSWHMPPGIMTFEHRDKEGRQFFGTLHQAEGWATIDIQAKGQPARSFGIRPGSSGYPYNKTELWAPTLWAYERMARSGEMPQSFDQLMHKNNIFMAGWRSVLHEGGDPVKLEHVPDDFESPVALPNRQGDPTVSQFRQKFG